MNRRCRTEHVRTVAVAQAMLIALVAAGSARAAENEAPPEDAAQTDTIGWTPLEGPGLDLWQRDTLTDNWFGLGEPLEQECGITFGLGTTLLYQVNTHGGLSTHRKAGRFSGSYDLEIEVDFATLLGLEGLTAYVLTEGSWGDGINPSMVGSVMGVNDDAGGDREIDVTELWFNQRLADGAVQVRFGKIDLSGGFDSNTGMAGGFDSNAFANDETAQFLASPLVNNPTIPFPENGLGVAVFVEPCELLYVAVAAADADADARLSGFTTAFDADHNVFTIIETGLMPVLQSPAGPLPGTYRVGLWVDGRTIGRLDGTGTDRNDVGVYLSFDQLVLRESADADDGQGLGLFARMGMADESLREVELFWSAGAAYQGLIPGRDDDVLGVGVASAQLSRDGGYADPSETITEVYYSIQVAPWTAVSPLVQYVCNPGGTGADSALVAGLRAQIVF